MHQGWYISLLPLLGCAYDLYPVNNPMPYMLASSSHAPCRVNCVEGCARSLFTCMGWIKMRSTSVGKSMSRWKCGYSLIDFVRDFRQEHICKALCQSRGICKIETAPQSVEVTFSGRHDTFQYTKVSDLYPVC